MSSLRNTRRILLWIVFVAMVAAAVYAIGIGIANWTEIMV